MLIEALPWLTRFHGKTVVIKYGGNAMVDEELKAAFAQDVVFLRYAGLRPVVVHGGGPQISAQLDRLGIAASSRPGLRVTTPEAMDVVRMVLAGQVQRDSSACSTGTARSPSACPARTRTLFTADPQARRSSTASRSTSAWSARSSRSTRARSGPCSTTAASRSSPASPRGDDGEVYNVNADTAAAALAVALGAEKLIVLTDVEGLYADWPDSDRRDQPAHRGRAGGAAARPVQRHGAQDGGAACTPCAAACRRPHVLDGRVPHSILLEIFTDEGIGTMVVPGR